MKVGDLVKHQDGYIGLIMDINHPTPQLRLLSDSSNPHHSRYYFSSGDVGFWTNADRLEVINESR